MKKLNIKLIFGFLFLSLIQNTYAAGTESKSDFLQVSFIIFLIIVFITAFVFILETNPNSKISYLNILPILIDIKNRLSGTQPLDKEKELLLDHEYDGITELDNNLPPWWKYLFYLTIVWSGIYLIYYHVSGTGLPQDQEYIEEVKYAEMKKAEMMLGGGMIDENNVVLLSDPGALFSGKETYDKHCAACHGRKGEGLVGPNLTDNYWLHGNSIKEVFIVIKEGVPAKGMISWKSQLTPVKMQEVGSYILSLVGTKPENPKPAEGQLYN